MAYHCKEVTTPLHTLSMAPFAFYICYRCEPFITTYFVVLILNYSLNINYSIDTQRGRLRLFL